jgi:hypothetical protein
MPQRRLETEDRGISLREIQAASEDKSLYDMLVLAKRKVWILEKLANEDPDEALAALSFAPLSNSLACEPLRWLTKRYTRKMNYSSFARGWLDMRADLIGEAKRVADTLKWICELASDGRLFDFEKDGLDRDAKTDFSDYLTMVRSSRLHRDSGLRATDSGSARRETLSFISRNIVHTVLMGKPRRAQ